MERIVKILELLQQLPKDNFLRHALALEYLKKGENEKARLLFEEILQEDPQYIGSYYHLAKLLEAQGETELALHWYLKGMENARKLEDQHALNELRAAYDELAF